jgi:hypothetical protein
MNSRKENETFYQINSVELSDEALAKVVGGCGGYNDCDHNGGWGNSDSWNSGDDGYGRGQRCRHRGVLGDLLCDLL